MRLLAFCCLLIQLALGLPIAAADYGHLSADAPPETAQFAFLIGEWHCETRNMRPDGSLADGPSATWTGHYTLDGWAIRDDWHSVAPNGKPSHGFNIRSFNPQTRQWDNRWLASGALQWKYFSAEQVDDTMVMVGGEGVDGMERAFIDRNVFHDIEAASWKWRKDRSFDGGTTWIEGVARIECRSPTRRADADVLPPEARQFDFWHGGWDVNLRIRQDGKWPSSSVSAKAEIYSILDGKAVLELWDSEPIKGFSLRYFDTHQGKWMLWLNWPRANSSGSSGLTGSFHHGRGEFFSENPTADGGTRISRYTFSDITPASLRWDDAYSTDGGETWRHQWRMELSRTAPRAELPKAGEDAFTYGDGKRCTDVEFRRFEGLAGEHAGSLRVRDGDTWHEGEARLVGYRVLGGCAVLATVEANVAGQHSESFHQLTWNTYASVFEESTLDRRADSSLNVFYGRDNDGSIVLLRRPAFGEEITPGRRIWRFGDRIEIETQEGGPGDEDTWQTVEVASFYTGD